MKQFATVVMVVVVAAAGALLAVTQVAQGAVDDSSPDLSVFKLRRVSSGRFTSERSHGPLRDLEAAAVLLHESLFTDHQTARCAAYAHLFKLVARQRQVDEAQTGASSPDNEVRLDTVIALATVAETDRAEYEQLMKGFMPEVGATLGHLFKEAIVSLERCSSQTSDIKDTWLELIECAQGHELGLDGFLAKPNRAALLKQYKAFKALPVSEDEEDDDDDDEQPPVRSQKPQVMSFTEAEINEARLKIEHFDDTQVRELRNKIRAQSKGDPPLPEVADGAVSDIDNEDARPSGTGGLVIELPVPTESSAPAKGQLELDPDFVSDGVAKMTFMKRWLNHAPVALHLGVWDHTHRKLTMESVLDYQHYWNEFQKFKQQGLPDSYIGDEVRDFLDDEDNEEVAETVLKMATDFRRITALLEVVQRNEYTNFKDLERDYDELIATLGRVDKRVDVYDFCRGILAARTKELQKLKTMNKFIESEGFW